MRKMHVASLCLLGAMGAAQGVASTTNYTASASTWVASIQNGAYTYESLPTGSTWDTSAGVSDAAGYIFSGPDGSNWSLQSSLFGGTTGLLGAEDGVGGVLINLPGSGMTAMFLTAQAVRSGATTVNGDSLTLALYSGSSETSSQTFSGGPIGFSTSYMVTSVLISPITPNDGVFLSSVATGTSTLPLDSGGGQGNPAPAPEAATLALVSGGILVVFGARRRLAPKLAF